MPPTVTLRPSGPDDAEFFYRVYANTRYEELAVTGWSADEVETFLRMQFRAQDTFYREQFPATAFDVILVNGESAGRLYVDRRPDEISIVDIALLPAFRGAGIGTRLLHQLLAEADAARLPVRIHVEVFNPARRLYDRLGFVKIDSTGVYDLMERVPVAP